ncbi:amidohydrolase [Castellaniella sp.]|uniref:amidohydrolase family protein n=1 Tax=Castellaniella sp. TaxID=1955812 RepID=UPI0035605358
MPDNQLQQITHCSPDKVWLASRIEPIVDPEQPIIDPHHHFSDHWGGYFAKDLLEDLDSGHDVRATVYVQCGLNYRTTGPEHLRPVGETESVLSIIGDISPSDQARRQVASGIVGYADLMLGESVDEVLEAHLQVAGSRFRGIRNSGAYNEYFKHGVLPRPPKGLYLNKDFQRGFARLKKFDLSFESWLYHDQLDDLFQLARAFPDTPIMINHIGCPLGVGPCEGKGSEVIQQWQPLMKKLSSCDNLHVKLGGLGTAVFGYRYFDLPNPPSSRTLADDWRPYFETCIDFFGPERCLFESNFPVDRSASNYHVLWNAFKRIASGATPSEKNALFHDNAVRFYRLPIPPVGAHGSAS